MTSSLKTKLQNPEGRRRGGKLPFYDLFRIFGTVQKICAILLLVPLAALSLEWARVSSYCSPSVSPECNVAAKMDGCHTCCKKAENPKEKKTSGCSDNCLDCPMCYVATFQPLCRFDVMVLPEKEEYAVMPKTQLPDYYRQHWKPPNAFYAS